MSTSGWRDVKRWILGFGSHAKVLEPEELKDIIKNDLKLLQEVYDV